MIADDRQRGKMRFAFFPMWTLCHVINRELFASNWSRMVAVPVVCALSFVNSVELLSKRALNLRVPCRSPTSSLPPGVNRTPVTLAADLQLPSLQVPLHFLVVPGGPTQEGCHGCRQATFVSGSLTLAQRGLVYFSRSHVQNQQSGANTSSPRHFFPGRQHQRAGHILVGIVAIQAFLAILAMLTLLPAIPYSVNAVGLASLADGIGSLFRACRDGFLIGLGLLLLIVVLRMATRRIWIADWLAVFLFSLSTVGAVGSGLGRNIAVLAFMTPVNMVWVWLLRRFGFLAMLVLWVGANFLILTPFMVTGWIAGQTLPFRLIPVAVAVWALWVILSDQRRPATESAA
jgi:hypothetical protein